VAMDLDRTRYQTFGELVEYCRRVASAVGLICIAVFGCRTDAARDYAENLGLALQLTNILRDVRDDYARGRVYLPLEDLERYGVRVEQLAAIRHGKQLRLNQRELLEGLAQRAEDYYKSGFALLPLISPDARPALWVLITIYHRLLRRIERRNYDVFSERVSVPLLTRISILLRGLARVFRNRIFGRGAAQ